MRFKLKGLGSFIYQILYHSIVVLIIAFIIGASVPHSAIKQCLSLGCWFWFVPCYLGLYIISPVLNAYVENTSLKTQGRLIVLFFLFETLYGWLFSPDYFSGGYSIISFIGLYLLMRYLRGCEDIIERFNGWLYFLLFVFFSVIPAVIVLLGIQYGVGGLTTFLTAYSSPIVIAASLFFFLSFARLKVKKGERIIKWMASGMFAVVLIQMHPVVAPNFRALMRSLYISNTGITYTIIAIAMTCVILFFSVFFDKLRLFTWKKVSSGIDSFSLKLRSS